MNNNENPNNDFLKEIQSKINRRSKGLYYNNSVKYIKRNLIIISITLLIIAISMAVFGYLSNKTAKITNIEQKTEKINNFKKIETKTQKNRYMFFKNAQFKEEEKIILIKITEKYTKKTENDKIIFEIPNSDLNDVLKHLSTANLTLATEEYISETDTNEIVFEKSLLE